MPTHSELDSDSRSSSPEHNVSDGEVDTVRARGRAKGRTTLRFQDEAKEVQRRSMQETKMKRGATLQETTRFVPGVSHEWGGTHTLYRLLDLRATLDEVQDSLSELMASINSKVDPKGLLGKVSLR